MSRNVELESAIKYTISNPTRYNGFLRVAANNFRLSTANQLFVYYQKEDADIVLDAGRWEKLFGRIVADNAQKIRIVQTGKTGKPQWTTYYDIADTIVTDDSKPVMRATVAQDVSMEQIREIAEKKMLLASSQIEDYMAANGIIAPAERIIGFIKDSIISEVAIKCGQEPLLYYEQINDFRKWALKDERIFKVFSAFFHNISNEMVNELSATQQRENDIETERTGGNRSDNTRGIEGEGSSAGTDGERRRGIAGINHRTEIISGKVREAETGILGESEPSTNNDLGRVPVGADSISESSSAASVTNEAADDETAHHEKGDNGGIETSESDVVGSKNDNGAERSGGSNSPRSDLHRIEQTIELADYSDEEQDELLNQVLCASKDLKYKIYFTYERQLRDEKMSAADFAKFIANAYGTGGAYPFTKYKGQDINLAYDLSKGLQLRAGFKDKGLSYTWRVVGRRIRHLIEDNRYLTEDEKTGYLEYIHNEEIRTRRAAIGKDLLSLVRKYNEETENKETWVNTYELTFVLNAYEGREISFGSKSVRKSLDSVLDTITTFGGEKYLPAVDGIKNRLIIEDNAEKQEKKNWIYSAADLAEPKVTILWSESEELQDGQVMSLYEANSTFERLDGERHEAQGYDKTKFKINYVLDGEVGSYEGRYDIGDGDGSLIDHISTYQTDFLDNEKWDAYIKERDGEEALATDKKQRKQLVYKFIPYLNLHVALSEIEAQANKRLERSANLSDGINAYYDALLEYVVNSRASINNGNFDLPKVPHITDYDEELIAYAKQVNDAVIAEANSDVNDTAIIDNEEHTIPHHQYTDGETVYIGAEEYVITSISDNSVVVAQANAPLFTTKYNKEEFEQKLLENPLNSKYLCETDTLSLAAADEPDADVDLDSDDVEEAKEVSESKTITDDFAEYENVKRNYPESYVLYQVGDFYEAYREDAQEVAQMLDLRVTNHLVRDDLRVSMCGFPVHALEQYLPIIQQHEKSVAVCSRDSNGLIVNTYTAVSVNADVSTYIGRHITDGDREFVVETIQGEDVSLRDLTFERANGFPITRKEHLDWLIAAIDNENEDAPITEEKQEKITDTDYVFPNENPGVGTPSVRIKNNLAAIRLVKKLDAEKRVPTAEEKDILAKYVGWGGLPDVFEEKHTAYAELKELLTEEEYDSARSSVLTAFYTDPQIIRGMYEVLERMGFDGGKVLEPSCGIGTFIGCMPESMRANSEVHGVELDTITGKIAKYLYPQSDIQICGYEKTDYKDNTFDLAIGNVPFGDFGVIDKRYDAKKWLIHDYFFGKTMDKVRSGGIIAFITSTGTMDKRDCTFRDYLASRGELLGAVRLPDTAFKTAAGTSVNSDIIFLKKREKVLLTSNMLSASVEEKLSDLRVPEVEKMWSIASFSYYTRSYINEYYAINNEMLCGDAKKVSGRFGNEVVYKCDSEEEFKQRFENALSKIQGKYEEKAGENEVIEEIADDDLPVPADVTARMYSYLAYNDDIYYRDAEVMRKVDTTDKTKDIYSRLIRITAITRELLDNEARGMSDYELSEYRTALNTEYDNFVKLYGRIQSKQISRLFSTDSSYNLICALEVYDGEQFKDKTDIFYRRTIRVNETPTTCENAHEALAISINERADIDFDYMTNLCGLSEDQLIEDLKGEIFFDPQEDKYVMADEYLSGNVREKLICARAEAQKDASFNINVEKLEIVQPEWLTAADISVKLGSFWIPQEYIAEFINKILQVPQYGSKAIVEYSNRTATWNIANKAQINCYSNATTVYGTQRAPAANIIEQSLNGREVVVNDVFEDANGKKVTVKNVVETTVAQTKQSEIEAEFIDWIWNDEERRRKLEDIYNNLFNAERVREYDGSHLTFPGMNPDVTLRPHQSNAIARQLYGGNTLLAHSVGAGKTYTIIATVMERKRLGLFNKALVCVPNHIVKQWGRDWNYLYPNANILVPTEDDFKKENRRRLFAKISTGNWDAVIIGHSQLEKADLSPVRKERYLMDEISDTLAALAEAKEQRKGFTVKDLERRRKQLEKKLSKLHEGQKSDDFLFFENLGIDSLYIDESHMFKNLYFDTKISNVAGVSSTDAQKTADLYYKIKYLREINGEKCGVTFATGTPISNSMAEIYTIQRYLQPEELARHQMSSFDAWVSTFGVIETKLELLPEGSGYQMKRRFAKFHNIPELMTMFRSCADIQTKDMLDLVLPKVERETITTKPTAIQREMIKALGERGEKIRNKAVSPDADNMLKITNEGRMIALDPRIVNNLLPDVPDSRVSIVSRKIFDIWQQTKDDRKTIAVFCDLSTPSAKSAEKGFCVYTDLRDKLIALGIPEKEIAFIHDAKNAKQKEKMFERVNNGEIRVIMGSTSKMGAGTNIQKKLYALFHLDCPWRPSDLEQQEGRIERQGNGNDTVKIFTCITEGTFDGYMYQLIEAKQRVAAQIMTSKSPAREVEEDDVMTLNYAELKALTMENPVFKEKMDLEIAISRLKMQKSNYLSNKYRMEDKLAKEFPRLISETKTGIENLTKDAATYVKNERAEFTITINGVVYTDRVEGGKAMTAYAGRMLGRKIGEYHGFDLYAGMKAEWLQVMVKGATAYWFELGPDAGGNIQRLNNLIKSYPERLLTAKKDLENLYAEQKTVSETVKKPFFHETELKQKLARLAEIDNQIAQSEKEKSEDTAKGVINDEQEKKFGVEDYCREYATGEIATEYEAESSM